MIGALDERSGLHPEAAAHGRPGWPILALGFLAAVSAAHLAPASAQSPVPAAPACAELRLDMLTPSQASTPYVVLDAGGRTGPWLLDFGSTITSVYADAWANRSADEPLPPFDFRLPGAGSAPRQLNVVEGGRLRAGVGAPLGVLGTDVLRETTTEIRFGDGGDPQVIFRDPACDGAAPGREGLRRVDQTNVFGSRPETHTSRLPNVPVVRIELEERSTDRNRPRLAAPRRTRTTLAQIDTGYADTVWPFTVDINEAFLAELKETVPSLAIAGLVQVSGCGSEDSLREVYVAPGFRLNVVPDIPQRPIPFDGFHFVLKPRTTECGGIGPMTVPAAQLGASFLRAFGTTLIRPAKAEIWIGPPRRE